MRTLLLIAAIGVLGFTISELDDALSNTDSADLSSVPSEPLAPLPAPEPEPEPVDRLVEHEIRSGENLGSIFKRYGITGTLQIVEAAKVHADLSRIRAGRLLRFHYDDGAEEATRLSYALDEDRTLVVHLGETPTAELEETVYAIEIGTRSMLLERTLWDAALGAGLRPTDIATLAKIFEYEIDFNTELRAGARFSLVFDELHRDGEYAKPGTFHAVRLENAGEVWTAVRYVNADGEEGWYAPDGTARKRPFLRSPLEFSRVTSGFNPRRYHPIAKTRRPHNGTDFGAPTGTPIRATGDGVVSFSGKNGGYGNHIKLDHAGPYVTTYSHLSRLAVKRGQRVKQGELIGYVGSTGYSTGPHLHYEFHVNGSPVDAMKVDLPGSIELPAAEKPALRKLADGWIPLLDAATDAATDAETDTAADAELH